MVNSIREALVSLESRMDRRFEAIDKRFAQIDRRFEQIAKRFEGIDRRFEAVDLRFDALDAKMSRQFVWLVGAIGAVLIAVVDPTHRTSALDTPDVSGVFNLSVK